MTTRIRLTLATWMALVLMVPTLNRLTSDRGALVAGALMISGVLGSAALLRWRQVADWVISLVQAGVIVAGAVSLLFLYAETVSWADFLKLIGLGLHHFRNSGVPLAPDPGLTLIIVLVLGVLALTTDVFIEPNHPAVILIPQLVIFVAPNVSSLTVPAGIGSLACLAVGLALVLFASTDFDWASGRRAVIRRVSAAGAVAAVTTVGVLIAALLATVVPIPESRGRTNDPIQMSDPSLDLKRNLAQRSNDVAFTYTTDQPTGTYFRLTSLPSFDAAGFRLTNSTVRTGGLPAPPGYVDGGTVRTTTITIGALQSEWLPVPYAPTRVHAGDGWGHLEDLSILALNIPDREEATAAMTYQVTSIDIAPTIVDLEAATGHSTPEDDGLTAKVPKDVPASIVRLTKQVTAGQTTAAGKAQAIVTYLQGPDFTYSLDPAPGSGYQTLERFLLRDKKGYCEQYAAAMALMARIAGVPSRVAVGFTAGKASADGRYTVLMKDMHTWPELWIDRWGWVAFEPTPSYGSSTNQPRSHSTPTPQQPTPEAQPTAEPTAEPEPGATEDTAGTIIPIVAGVLVVAAVLAGPSWWRRRQRTSRLRTGPDPRLNALAAWAELEATLIDHELAMPPGSPRFAAAKLAAHHRLGSADEGVAALALAAEMALFAPAGTISTSQDWTPVILEVEEACRQRWSGWKLAQIRVFPRSIFS